MFGSLQTRKSRKKMRSRRKFIHAKGKKIGNFTKNAYRISLMERPQVRNYYPGRHTSLFFFSEVKIFLSIGKNFKVQREEAKEI